MQSCVHTQEKPEKALHSHLWLILRLCNQELKAKAEWQIPCWNTGGSPTHIYSPSGRVGDFLG